MSALLMSVYGTFCHLKPEVSNLCSKWSRLLHCPRSHFFMDKITFLSWPCPSALTVCQARVAIKFLLKEDQRCVRVLALSESFRSRQWVQQGRVNLIDLNLDGQLMHWHPITVHTAIDHLTVTHVLLHFATCSRSTNTTNFPLIVFYFPNICTLRSDLFQHFGPLPGASLSAAM